MRLHPGVTMVLERYVPEGGFTLPNGTFVPAGTRAGLNPYIVNRNKGVWGEDADSFRPERWLQAEGESKDDFQKRLTLYNKTDLAFGAGSRICTGRHLALLQVHKLVATMVARYEIELTHPEREWEVTCSWFTRQKGLICNMKERSAKHNE